MKTLVKIALKPPAKIFVEEEAEIEKGQKLAIIGLGEEKIEINLSGILKIKPADIFKYLKCSPNDTVSEGQKIAEKRSLFTSLTVRSPDSGKIKEVDLKKGTLMLVKSDPSAIKIILPVKGKIKSISKDSITVEVKGEKITGLKGWGNGIVAKLKQIPIDRGSIFDFGEDVTQRLVLMSKISSEILSKLDTLDASGVITQESEEMGYISVLIVAKDDYKILQKADERTVWLRPEEKEVIVLED